ncbi:MAG: RidA family protein [Mucilaginibacter sp.]
MSKNPFPVEDKDRHELWEIAVNRDIKAFIAQDWALTGGDFHEENFMGIDAGFLGNPDAWKLTFPNLEAYKTEWLKQAKEFAETAWAEDPEASLFRITVLRDIDVQGDSAILHKKFFGNLKKANGELVPANWQTLYHAKKINGSWKLTGFTGYMPHFLGDMATAASAKKVPANAAQHTTAGPYSPVLEINAGKLVVISGQAAIDMDGKVIGDTIEEQAAYTIDNCARQLAYAGCTLDDVFKVNVYMKDLADWPRFNTVYKNYFNEPRPVRAAVQTGLLMTLLVEIEMWAVKS